MSLTVKAGDTLWSLARNMGIPLRALVAANPGVDPRRLRVGQKLSVPGSRDDFSPERVRHDASAQRALRELEQTAGPTFSARELMRAIDRGTADYDANMAGGELKDFAQWAKAHQEHLTGGAKKVMALYSDAAASAREQGRTGLTDAERARLLQRMALVNEGSPGSPRRPSPSPSPSPAPGDGPKSARDWQREALQDPAGIFKRQVRDRRWNNDPDAPLYSGHCAIASLAMAAEAFGRERKGLDTKNHSKDQDSIDDVARLMPDKFKVEKNGGHTWLSRTSSGPKAGTYPYQMAAAAEKLGLEHKGRSGMSMSELDQALAKGHMVCLSGEAGAAFRAAQGHSFSGGHSILVMGKTSDGRYLVCDPLSKKGPTKLTRAQLASFDTRGYTSTEVWRGK